MKGLLDVHERRTEIEREELNVKGRGSFVRETTAFSHLFSVYQCEEDTAQWRRHTVREEANLQSAGGVAGAAGCGPSDYFSL